MAQEEVRWLVHSVLALVAVLIALGGARAWVAALCTAPAWLLEALPIIGALLIKGHKPPVVRAQPTRLLVALTPAAILLGTDARTADVVTVVIVALLPLGEAPLSRVVRSRSAGCRNLPGIGGQMRPPLRMTYLLGVTHLAIAAGLIALATATTMVICLILALVSIALMLIALVHAAVTSASVAAQKLQVAEAIADYQPQFVLYYSAPRGSEYQVKMWLPYLERIGRRFIVVMRSSTGLDTIAESTEAPVVVRSSIRSLDEAVPPSLTTAFYVNNGKDNSHFVRYTHLTHVQLLHGESDKAASASPVTAMFDKIFVAGQAGIDRYAAHGIHIPRDKFAIVGRPQVEAVEPRVPGAPVGRVLYAPTWQGYQAETNYTSLGLGPQMIRALVGRGRTVVFRPHPFSYRDEDYAALIEEIHRILDEDRRRTGHEHLWGEIAEQEMTLFDCFNNVDALVSDVSSVIPDFLFSYKPFAIVAADGSPTDEFESSFPIARAGYVIEAGLENLDTALDRLLETDPRSAARARIRERYLGPFPADGYADAFLQAARETIDGPEEDRPRSADPLRLPAL